MSEARKHYVTYNDVHNQCKRTAEKILESFKPTLIIAIGGGGFIPARILRTFLKKPQSPNIPIQAIGLSLYERLGTEDDPVETVGTRVTRTQWLDFSSLSIDNLVGRDVLIVDEVDDTRTTLEYAIRELNHDVTKAAARMGKSGPEAKTNWGVFVLHNKDKPKKGSIPEEVLADDRYFAAETIPDYWICYPWEATDIEEHDRLAENQKAGANTPEKLD